MLVVNALGVDEKNTHPLPGQCHLNQKIAVAPCSDKTPDPFPMEWLRQGDLTASYTFNHVGRDASILDDFIEALSNHPCLSFI